MRAFSRLLLAGSSLVALPAGLLSPRMLWLGALAVAFVIGNIATATVMVVQLLREYRRVRRPRPA